MWLCVCVCRVCTLGLRVWHREPHQSVQHQWRAGAACRFALHHSEGTAVHRGWDQHRGGQYLSSLFRAHFFSVFSLPSVSSLHSLSSLFLIHPLNVFLLSSSSTPSVSFFSLPHPPLQCLSSVFLVHPFSVFLLSSLSTPLVSFFSLPHPPL